MTATTLPEPNNGLPEPNNGLREHAEVNPRPSHSPGSPMAYDIGPGGNQYWAEYGPQRPNKRVQRPTSQPNTSPEPIRNDIRHPIHADDTDTWTRITFKIGHKNGIPLLIHLMAGALIGLLIYAPSVYPQFTRNSWLGPLTLTLYALTSAYLLAYHTLNTQKESLPNQFEELIKTPFIPPSAPKTEYKPPKPPKNQFLYDLEE